ncbi:MAG: hypothetical protein RLZZ437_3044 [Pseudomonadota bacterium]
MVILCHDGLTVADMRVLSNLMSVLALSGWSGAAAAQGGLPEVQKAAQDLPQAGISAEAFGLPIDPVEPKVGNLVASKAADSNPSDFDPDKIAGNAPVSQPLTERTKAPGRTPDIAPTPAELGTGPDGEKLAVAEVSVAAAGRITTYDTDKIDGNPETFAPLADRQKAPGQLPEAVSEAELGLPASPEAPKDADVSVRHADARPSIYDEDKVDGNEPPPLPLSDRQKAASVMTASMSDADLGIRSDLPLFKSADLAVSYAAGGVSNYDEDKIAGNGEDTGSGPLTERQKYPSELAEGTDPAAFGQPAADSAKQADLQVSKAAQAVTSVEDNDKIAGNPYVEPPLLPRQKQPSTLPDPVVDADMGQPAADVTKTDTEISKAALAQPTIDDNDKIAGNPVIAPPLAERAKAASYDTPPAGISDADLGLPAAPEAEKLAEVAISKSEIAVTTEYDDDKIAGNSYTDPAFDDSSVNYNVDPPDDVITAVQNLLEDPAARATMMETIAARGLAPPAVAEAFEQYIAALFDNAEVRNRAATEIARVHFEMGVTPGNPETVGRMAAEYIALFGEAEARLGMRRLPVDVQRNYLAGLLRIAEGLPVELCGPFLDGTLEVGQERRLILSAIADWAEKDRTDLLIERAAATIVEVQDAPFDAMTDADAGIARQALGSAAMAAIDASENATAMLTAFSDPFLASPADLCAVHKLILQGTLATSGPDADLGVRYLVQSGWQR